MDETICIAYECGFDDGAYAGYEVGYDDGYDDGNLEGYDDGLDTGMILGAVITSAAAIITLGFPWALAKVREKATAGKIKSLEATLNHADEKLSDGSVRGKEKAYWKSVRDKAIEKLGRYIEYVPDEFAPDTVNNDKCARKIGF